MTDFAAAIIATMRHPVLVLDGDLRVRQVNRAFSEIYAVTAEEAEGCLLYELGNNQWDIPGLRRLLTELLNGRQEITDYPVEHEFQQLGKRLMLLNVRHMKQAGAPDTILLAIEDITEREKERWELESEKEFAEKIIDASREALLILDWNLRVKSANETFYETFKVDRDETEGCLVYDLGNGQWDIPRLREALENVLPENNSFDDLEVVHDFKKIGRREMVLNGRKIDHKQWILLAIEDVTERELSVRALRESQERLRKALETEALGVIFFDENKKNIIGSNDAFLKLTGYDRGRVESGVMTYCDITPPEWMAVMEEQWKKLHRTGRLGPYEKEIFLKDRSRRWMLISGRSLGDGTVVEYCFDISDRKEAEKQRELLLAELNHRVKNTLAVVQGLALQTLKRSRSLEEFKTVFRGRLNALARGHNQLLKGEWKTADLGVVVEDAVCAFGPDRVQFQGPAVHLSSRAALSLNMVLHELETNSAKYGALSTEEGRVDIRWGRAKGGLISMSWRESGGPKVAAPEREGFGTRLIRQLVKYELGGEADLHFERKGFRAEFIFRTAQSA